MGAALNLGSGWRRGCAESVRRLMGDSGRESGELDLGEVAVGKDEPRGYVRSSSSAFQEERCCYVSYSAFWDTRYCYTILFFPLFHLVFFTFYFFPFTLFYFFHFQLPFHFLSI